MSISSQSFNQLPFSFGGVAVGGAQEINTMSNTYTRNYFTTEHAINNEIECIHDALASGCIDWREYATPELLDAVKGFSVDDVDFVLIDLLVGKGAGYYAEGVIQIPVGEIEVQFEGKASEFFSDIEDWTIDGDLAYTSLPSIAFNCDLDELKSALAEFAA